MSSQDLSTLDAKLRGPFLKIDEKINLEFSFSMVAIALG